MDSKSLTDQSKTVACAVACAYCQDAQRVVGENAMWTMPCPVCKPEQKAA